MKKVVLVILMFLFFGIILCSCGPKNTEPDSTEVPTLEIFTIEPTAEGTVEPDETLAPEVTEVIDATIDPNEPVG